MTIITSGKRLDGTPCTYALDEFMKKNLDQIKHRVEGKNWDNKIIVAGYSGVGKSHTTQFFARYLCPWFDSNYYCFTIDEFIQKCTEAPEHTAIVLDESFDSMNSKLSLSREFQKVVSFLQIIRQKHLYIFLLLPNFFDLQKSVALYNTNMLVVSYTDKDDRRGCYAVYDRDRKKSLYIKGNKMIDYLCVKPNFVGRVPATPIIDWDEYERRKKEHLISQIKEGDKDEFNKKGVERDRMFAYFNLIMGISVTRLVEISKTPKQTIYDGINRQRNEIEKKFKVKEEPKQKESDLI